MPRLAWCSSAAPDKCFWHSTLRYDVIKFPLNAPHKIIISILYLAGVVKQTQNEDMWHSNRAQAAQLCTCIPQMPGLKLGGYTDQSVTWFSSISTSKFRDITSVRPRSLLSKSFPIRHSPVILPSKLQCGLGLLPASFNKPHTHKTKQGTE
jgi:hypothetical protein